MKKQQSSAARLFKLLCILIMPFLVIKMFWNFLTSPVDPKAGVNIFVVPKDVTVSDIAEILEKEKFIKSSLAFKMLYKFEGEKKIDSGDFKLSSSFSTQKILKTLTTEPIDKWVTLLEGWRVEEMANELNAKLKVKSSRFVELGKKYEGYLFPDTYLFNPDVTEESIIETMRANFDRKYNGELRQKIESKGLTEEQGVILASLVEREARSFDARKMVASILLKRFKIGMGLNADATIQYALGYQSQEKSWWKRHLTADDLKINSPYNTYLYMGFPPTPISNPSLSSLQAVADADSQTPYLYYYHDLKGKAHYGKTLDEHNANITNNP